jgi:23S rRNA (cytidine1920-2'-O)/16S rRNA (cytidine1409-2'-O)-methyltransferase
MRLDRLLVERALSPSRERARALIIAGQVLVDDKPISKAGTAVHEDAEIRVREDPNQGYVSRGALKLKPAIEQFGVVAKGKVCLDVGASTGGFTDVLLQQGASRVYAVDVGYGQLAWRIRNDSRVVVLERTNARHLTTSDIDTPISLVVIDVSFISVKLILPALPLLLQSSADTLCMVKPQFEVGKGRVGKGGVVRDETLRNETVNSVCDHARTLGFEVLDRCDNDIHGPKGNIETFVHLAWP